MVKYASQVLDQFIQHVVCAGRLDIHLLTNSQFAQGLRKRTALSVISKHFALVSV